MKAIRAVKKKSHKIDARTIADLLRCNLFLVYYAFRRNWARCGSRCGSGASPK
jgi:hypothetical protein